MNHRRQRAEAWLRLLRPANLLTAPGDPLVGAMLAAADTGGSAAPPWAAMGAALALYAAGILDNDLTGLDEDRRTGRPRPLATGELPTGAAAGARLALFAAGLGAAAVAGRAACSAAAALTVLILAYHRLGRWRHWLGPAVLGLCRAVSLLMGALAVIPAAGGTRVALAAVVWCLLIGGLATAARNELSHPGRPELIGRLLCGWPLVQAAAVVLANRPGSFLAAGALAGLSWCAHRLRRRWPPS
ncbi:MAG: hypothetical protein N2652_05725 [Kiritimatiellae bacterium]|nr:hypothetical protein [Kiritimatiellia bacterium]